MVSWFDQRLDCLPLFSVSLFFPGKEIATPRNIPNILGNVQRGVCIPR